MWVGGRGSTQRRLWGGAACLPGACARLGLRPAETWVFVRPPHTT